MLSEDAKMQVINEGSTSADLQQKQMFSASHTIYFVYITMSKQLYLQTFICYNLLYRLNTIQKHQQLAIKKGGAVHFVDIDGHY